MLHSTINLPVRTTLAYELAGVEISLDPKREKKASHMGEVFGIEQEKRGTSCLAVRLALDFEGRL